MSDKTVHIVFQVINFLHGDLSKSYKLLPIDKLILITLASHHGAKGIFPGQKILTKELGIKLRHLQYRLTHLEKTGLILIEKMGRRHFYHLQIDAPQCAYPETIGAPQCAQQVHYSASNRCTTVRHKNKVSNKVNNRERALSVFEPDESNLILAHDLRLNVAAELDSFMNRHKGSKTQYEFGRWMKASKEYASRKGAVQEARSAVPVWGPGHPTYDSLYGAVKPNGANGNGLQVARNNGRGNGSR
jgi:hypothetical protein